MACPPLCAQQPERPFHVAVLTTDTLTSTQRAAYGAEKVVSGEHPGAKFTTFLVNPYSPAYGLTIDSIGQINPRLILTIGSSATEVAIDHFPATPIVFTAVKYPVLSGFVSSVNNPGQNITGASLDIPTSVQFTYFKQIIPALRTLGVLYTDSTAALIPDAEAVAADHGLRLIAVRVDAPDKLPAALDSLLNSVEAIWSVADPILFTPQATRYILLNTVKRNMPMMGFSRHVVESGALFGLDFDYKAVGQQAGSIVNRILAGEPPHQIMVTSADVIWFHYNENTAKRIRVRIPEKLASVAKEVYR